MSNKLPKHIVQLIEKNNLVMAIKTLADEQNISMSDAKSKVDAYEAKLKNKYQKKSESIAKKQSIKPTKPKPFAIDQADPNSNASNSLQEGLDQHLDQIGYKKPLIPFWAKRVIIFVVVILLLIFIFWQLIF